MAKVAQQWGLCISSDLPKAPKLVRSLKPRRQIVNPGPPEAIFNFHNYESQSLPWSNFFLPWAKIFLITIKLYFDNYQTLF
jgi:hypothetical protein